jgi:ATP-dependent RNA helicase SUPV3L1/SUV3
MASAGRIPEDWFSRQVAFSERTDGDIDTLSNRLAHIRTWTFVSNRADWLADPLGWQEKTRAIEDTLSDALHEQLTQRFVDRRTSALMRGMRDKDEMVAEIANDGAVGCGPRRRERAGYACAPRRLRARRCVPRHARWQDHLAR